jgi:hypothetical protein
MSPRVASKSPGRAGYGLIRLSIATKWASGSDGWRTTDPVRRSCTPALKLLGSSPAGKVPEGSFSSPIACISITQTRPVRARTAALLRVWWLLARKIWIACGNPPSGDFWSPTGRLSSRGQTFQIRSQSLPRRRGSSSCGASVHQSPAIRRAAKTDDKSFMESLPDGQAFQLPAARP